MEKKPNLHLNELACWQPVLQQMDFLKSKQQVNIMGPNPTAFLSRAAVRLSEKHILTSEMGSE